jgi:hypothetical protein
LSAPDVPTGPLRFTEAFDVTVFQKGNLHTHSSNSDGHDPPRDVYTWYREHGYAFVALTDHNQLTPKEPYRDLERKGFVIIPGEEITMSVRGTPVHVNALCSSIAIGALPDHFLEEFKSVNDALEWAVGKVLAQPGAVALVNHPNFVSAFTAEELPAARGAQLLEIWSGHPAVHGDGDDEGRPSEETIWETALSRGETFAGVAVDDTHYLHAAVAERWPSRPGRGWVQVFAEETTQEAICDALGKGRLYASSGAKLRRVKLGEAALSLWPDATARVEFLGEGGAVLDTLQTKPGGEATYVLKGTERYVRARITTTDGKHAWTQAYRAAR